MDAAGVRRASLAGIARGFEDKPARARAAPLEAACGDLGNPRPRLRRQSALDTASKRTSKIVEIGSDQGA